MPCIHTCPPPPRRPPPQAFNLFRARTGATQRFRVDLRKVVPHGAGLGGGSGNAATALWAANELCGRPATAAQLQEWSGAIGSDISVFFSLGAAYCTGRGEVVEDVPPPLPLDTPLLLVKPPVGLSTPEVFRALDLGRRSATDPLALLAALAEGGVLTPELTVNDLEQPAFDRWGGRVEGICCGGRAGLEEDAAAPGVGGCRLCGYLPTNQH